MAANDFFSKPVNSDNHDPDNESAIESGETQLHFEAVLREHLADPQASGESSSFYSLDGRRANPNQSGWLVEVTTGADGVRTLALRADGYARHHEPPICTLIHYPDRGEGERRELLGPDDRPIASIRVSHDSTTQELSITCVDARSSSTQLIRFGSDGNVNALTARSSSTHIEFVREGDDARIFEDGHRIVDRARLRSMAQDMGSAVASVSNTFGLPLPLSALQSGGTQDSRPLVVKLTESFSSILLQGMSAEESNEVVSQSSKADAPPSVKPEVALSPKPGVSGEVPPAIVPIMQRSGQLSMQDRITIASTIRENPQFAMRGLELLGRSLEPTASREAQIDAGVAYLGTMSWHPGAEGDAALRALVQLVIRNLNSEDEVLQRLCLSATQALGLPSSRHNNAMVDELRAGFQCDTANGINRLAEAGACAGLRESVVSVLREILQTNRSQPESPAQSVRMQAALQGLLSNGFNNVAGINELALLVGQTPHSLAGRLTDPRFNLSTEMRGQIVEGLIANVQTSRSPGDCAQALEYLSHFAPHLQTPFLQRLPQIASTAGSTNERGRILTAVARIGSLLMETTDGARQAQGLQIVDAATASGFRPGAPVQEQAVRLLRSSDEATATAATNFLLRLARTTSQQSDSIVGPLEQAARTNEHTRAALVAAAVTSDNSRASSLSAQILRTIGAEGAESARAVTASLLDATSGRTSANRIEIMGQIQALAQRQPVAVMQELERRPAGDVTDALAHLCCAENQTLRGTAAQALLRRCTNGSSRDATMAALGEVYGRSGSEHLVAVIAGVATGGNDADLSATRESVLARLSAAAGERNSRAISALTCLSQRNSDTGVDAARTLQQLARRNREVFDAVMTGTRDRLQNTRGNLNSPLLNLWSNLVTGQFSDPVSNDAQTEQRLSTAIETTLRCPAAERSTFFSLMGRFAAGDAGDNVAAVASRTIPLLWRQNVAGSRPSELRSLLIDNLGTTFATHGDRHSLLETIAYVRGRASNDWLADSLNRQLQPAAGETAIQQSQRLEGAARMLNGLLVANAEQPLSRAAIQQLLATPETREAYQRAAIPLARCVNEGWLPGTTAADVQAITDFATRVENDSNLSGTRRQLISLVENSLSGIMCRSTNEAAQGQAYDYLRTRSVDGDAVAAYARQRLERHPQDLAFLNQVLPLTSRFNPPRQLIDQLMVRAGQQEHGGESTALLLQLFDRAPEQASASIAARLQDLATTSAVALNSLADHLVADVSDQTSEAGNRRILRAIAATGATPSERVINAVIQAAQRHETLRSTAMNPSLHYELAQLVGRNPEVGVRMLGDSAVQHRFALDTLTRLMNGEDQTLRTTAREQLPRVQQLVTDRLNNQTLLDTDESRLRLVSALTRTVGLTDSPPAVLEQLCRTDRQCLSEQARMLGALRLQPSDHRVISSVFDRLSSGPLAAQSRQQILETLMAACTEIPANQGEGRSRVISEIGRLTAADGSGQSVRFLEEQARGAGAQSRIALLAICEAAAMHQTLAGPPQPNTEGARAAFEAAGRLLGDNSNSAQTTSPPSVQSLFQDARRNLPEARNAIFRLANGGFREAVTREFIRGYTAQDSDSLRLIAAVIRQDDTVPPIPRTPQSSATQYQEAVNLLSQQLQNDLVIGTIAGDDQQQIQSRQRASAVTSLLTLNAAGSGGRALAAAHALMNEATGGGLWTAVGGQGNIDSQPDEARRRFAQAQTRLQTGITDLLGQREFSAEQARYLINMCAYSRAYSHSSYEQQRTVWGIHAPYRHQELPEHSAPLLAADGVPEIINSLLSSGTAGEQARAALASQSAQCNAQTAQFARSTEAALRSRDPATLEPALSLTNLGRLTRFALSNASEGGATTAERRQILQSLMVAGGNGDVSLQARQRAVEAVRAIVANDCEHNTGSADSPAILMDMALSGNSQARQLLYSLAAGQIGTSQTSARVCGDFLTRCRSNESFRNTVLRELSAPQYDGGARLPLIVALMGGLQELPSIRDAGNRLCTLAREGNAQAITMLMSIASRPERRFGTVDTGAPGPERQVIAAREAYRVAGISPPAHIERIEDLGLGNLLTRLSAMVETDPAVAYQGLRYLGRCGELPWHWRERAMAAMVTARVPAGATVWSSAGSAGPDELAVRVLATLGGRGSTPHINYLAQGLGVHMHTRPQGVTPLAHIIRDLSDQANSGTWNDSRENAVRALTYLANSQLHVTSDQWSADGAVQRMTYGPHADQVRRILQEEARRGNDAAARTLSSIHSGISRETAADELGRALQVRLPHQSRPEERAAVIQNELAARAARGDRQSIGTLTALATEPGSSPELRAAATAHLRNVIEQGQRPAVALVAPLSGLTAGALNASRAALTASVNAAATTVVRDCILETCSAERGNAPNPAAFALLASLSARLPEDAALRQAVCDRFQALTAGREDQTPDALRQNRLSAALTILSNPQLLTADTSRSLMASLTPELARALPVVLRQHEGNNSANSPVRELLSALRFTSAAPPPGADVGALATTWSSMARLMTPHDTDLLAGLRNHCSVDAQRSAVDRAIGSVMIGSSDHETTAAALRTFQNAPVWATLSPPQQDALRDFASSGRTTDLQGLRQACHTIFGASHPYPLPVFLRQLGVPQRTTDAELCSVAERITARTGPGSMRSMESWAMPLLESANLAWQYGRVQRHTNPAPDVQQLVAQLQSYPDREHFLFAVMNDLGAGRLDPSRRFLIDFPQRFRDSGHSLQQSISGSNVQVESMQRDIARSTGLAEAAGRYRQALSAVEHSNRRWEGMEAPPADRGHFAASQLEAARAELLSRLPSAMNLTPQLEAMSTARGRIAGLQGEEHRRALTEAQAQYQMLVASGRQTEADTMMFRLVGQGAPLPDAMSRQFQQAWGRLQQQGLAPDRITPVFHGTPEQNFRSALQMLRHLEVNPNLNNLSPEAGSLHTAAMQAAADGAVAQIMHHPHAENMAVRAQELALRLSNLNQLMELGAECEPIRQQIRPHLEQQVRGLVAHLSSPEMRTAAEQLGTVVAELRTERDQMAQGSPGRQRLDQVVRGMESYLDVFRPGSPIRCQLDELAEGIQSGRLDEPSFWQRALSTLAHVVATTAAFALSTTISALAGPAAPLVWTVLTPALTTAARHLTQEALYGAGVERRGSALGDLFWGRTFYDRSTGTYREGSLNERGQFIDNAGAWSHVGGEYLHDLDMNLRFAGTGRLFRGLGSATAGGSFVAGATRSEHAAATSLWRTFRSEFNIRAVGVGLGLGAPDLFEIPHLGEAAGYMLSAWHGYRGGRANPRHTLETATRQLQLTEAQRLQYQERLSTWPRGERNAAIDALGRTPQGIRPAMLEFIANMSPELQVAQGHVPDAVTRAGFLIRMQEMAPLAREQMTERMRQTPELATVIGRLSSTRAVENLMTVVTGRDGLRQPVVRLLAGAPPELVAALCDISNATIAGRLVETLTESLGTSNFSANYNRSLGRLSIEQQRVVLEHIGQLQPGRAAGQVLADITLSRTGAQFAESLSSIPEAHSRQSLLNSLSAMEAPQRTRLLGALSGGEDATSRAMVLRQIGLMPAASREVLLGNMAGDARIANRAVRGLSHLSDVQGPAGTSVLQVALDALAQPSRHAGAGSRVMSMFAELRPVHLECLTQAASFTGDGARARTFLEQIGQLPSSERVRLAEVIRSQGANCATLSERSLLNHRIEDAVRQMAAEGSGAQSAVNRGRILDRLERNQSPRDGSSQPARPAGPYRMSEVEVAVLGNIPEGAAREAARRALERLSPMQPDVVRAFEDIGDNQVAARVVEAFAQLPAEVQRLLPGCLEGVPQRGIACAQLLEALQTIPEPQRRADAVRVLANMESPATRSEFIDIFNSRTAAPIVEFLASSADAVGQANLARCYLSWSPPERSALLNRALQLTPQTRAQAALATWGDMPPSLVQMRRNEVLTRLPNEQVFPGLGREQLLILDRIHSDLPLATRPNLPLLVESLARETVPAARNQLLQRFSELPPQIRDSILSTGQQVDRGQAHQYIRLWAHELRTGATAEEFNHVSERVHNALEQLAPAGRMRVVQELLRLPQSERVQLLNTAANQLRTAEVLYDGLLNAPHRTAFEQCFARESVGRFAQDLGPDLTQRYGLPELQRCRRAVEPVVAAEAECNREIRRAMVATGRTAAEIESMMRSGDPACPENVRSAYARQQLLQQQHADGLTNYRNALESAQRHIQDAVTNLIGPGVQVEVVPPGQMSSEGSYSWHTGRLRVSADVLLDPVKLAEIVSHELGHHMQATQVWRHHAQRLQIDAHSSESRLRQLSAEVQRALHDRAHQDTPADIQRIRDMLRHCENQPLNAARAEALVGSYREIRSYEAEQQSLNDLRDLRSSLTDPPQAQQAAAQLLARLRNTATVREIFGERVPDLLHQILQRTGQTPSAQELQTLAHDFARLLGARINDATTRLQSAHDRYRATLHEVEAWEVGDRVALRVRENQIRQSHPGQEQRLNQLIELAATTDAVTGLQFLSRFHQMPASEQSQWLQVLEAHSSSPSIDRAALRRYMDRSMQDYCAISGATPADVQARSRILEAFRQASVERASAPHQAAWRGLLSAIPVVRHFVPGVDVLTAPMSSHAEVINSTTHSAGRSEPHEIRFPDGIIARRVGPSLWEECPPGYPQTGPSRIFRDTEYSVDWRGRVSRTENGRVTSVRDGLVERRTDESGRTVQYENGRVSAISHNDGQQVELRYSSPHRRGEREPQEIRFPDGRIARRGGTTWTETFPAGHARANNPRTEVAFRLNESGAVLRIEQGRVSAVEDGGRRTEISYERTYSGGQSEPHEIRFPDGRVARRTGASQWTETYPSGDPRANSQARTLSNTRYQVDAQGGVLRFEQGRLTSIHDSQGRETSVTYGTNFSHDGNPVPHRISFPDGSTAELFSLTNEWVLTNASGQARPGTLTIEQNGTIVRENRTGWERIVTTTSGREVRPSSRIFECVGQVSPEFAQQMETVLQNLPVAERSLLARQGERLVVASTLGEAIPSLQGTPRGHAPGTTFRNLDGVHSQGLSVVAETFEVRGSPGVTGRPSALRRAGVARHELGHAIDGAIGREMAAGDLLTPTSQRHYSNSTEFDQAYQRDLAGLDRLSPMDRMTLRYFLQSGEAGRSETFAEAYGILRGGGCTAQPPRMQEIFRRAFPNTLHLVEGRLQQLNP